MSDYKKDYLKLRGLFVFDEQHYGSALTAFSNNALSSVCQGAGEPNNTSSLADWMSVAENTIQACGNKGLSVCWIDGGTAFNSSEICSIAGESDSLDRADLLDALNAQSGPGVGF